MTPETKQAAKHHLIGGPVYVLLTAIALSLGEGMVSALMNTDPAELSAFSKRVVAAFTDDEKVAYREQSYQCILGQQGHFIDDLGVEVFHCETNGAVLVRQYLTRNDGTTSFKDMWTEYREASELATTLFPAAYADKLYEVAQYRPPPMICQRRLNGPFLLQVMQGAQSCWHYVINTQTGQVVSYQPGPCACH